MDLTATLWSVGIAILAITLVRVLQLSKQGTDAARKAVGGTAFAATLNSVLDTIDSVLSTASSTIVVELKKKTSDGILTRDEINEIVQHVKQETLSLIGEDAKLILTGFVGDYEKWLEVKITPRVLDLANSQNVTTLAAKQK